VTFTLNCAGATILITPPQAQLQMAVLGKAGKMPTFVFIAPGDHGATVTGMQGMGVSTPKAAVVAAATIGLAIEVHMPNGRILAIGTKSIMLAANRPFTVTGVPFGMTISVLGATPKGMHCSVAPMQVCSGISFS